MTFPKADDLKTLSEARDAFLNQIAAHKNTLDELDAVKGDLQAANEMLDEATRTTAELTTQLQEGEQREKDLQSHLDGATKQINELTGRIRQLEQEIKSAESKAAEICASVGVEPVQVSPREGEGASQTDLLEQFRAIKDPAKQLAFYRKHREALIGRT